jgi:hypothetical protein
LFFCLSAVSIALFVVTDCLILSSKSSICRWISGDLVRRSSLRMQVSRCSYELIPLKRSRKSFKVWCPFSIVSSDLSARPPNFVNWSKRCPSKVRCHFGCRVVKPIRSHNAFPSLKAAANLSLCSTVGNKPE